MPDRFRIEDAVQADIPAMVRLLNELFTIEQDFQPDESRQVAGLSMLLQTPGQAVIKVARIDNGEAIGMVSAQLVISSAQGTPSAWIEDMVISLPYRSKGLGRLLLESALAWARERGASRAQLLVDLDNEPALGYYERLGWQTSRMGMRRILL